MKKLVLFISILFVAISFNSCNDDDDDVVTIDKIIGKWQWDQVILDGEEMTLTTCDKQSTIEFFLAGTFTTRDFEENENEVCTPLEAVNGTWENLGNSMYELGDVFEYNGFSLDVDVKITFTNNKMTIEFSGTDEDNVTHVLKAIFIKI